MDNKSDLEHESQLELEFIKVIVVEWGLSFYKTSAKKICNFNDVLEDLARQDMKLHTWSAESPSTPNRRNSKCIVQ